ncbi:MAG: hypothetical protein JW841_04470 [Deltaproteobacteria bacterium]|nr:hypothetical protein [Deltaproteobacteria bacterium]
MNNLPGADLINRGLLDLNNGRESVESLLVEIGAPRLRNLGIEILQVSARPEARLYAILANKYADAHSRYNALIRRLVSYEHALESALHR